MHGNSSPVTSTQIGIHEQLSTVVARHAASRFLKPIADYNHIAFDASVRAWKAAGSMPLILDAGCGVGLSTLHLATRFPDHFVIGVDQSAHRLSRNTEWRGHLPANLLHVRADLVDYWRLLLAAGIYPEKQCILYPNPWPKIGQLARRWHGHAVFPSIVALGGEIECRSNWRIYIEEFTAALNQLTGLNVQCEEFTTSSPMTPFEEKYLASGHALWRCKASVPAAKAQS